MHWCNEGRLFYRQFYSSKMIDKTSEQTKTKYAVDNGNDIWLAIMLQVFAVNIVTRTVFNDHGHVALATFLHAESKGYVKTEGQGQSKNINGATK